MVIKKLVHKIYSFFTRYENNGDVITGDVYNYYVMSKETYKALTNKNNYSDFYKRYILKFEELKGYAFSLSYPYFNKKAFDFTSKQLIFGKKIIDWIYGLSEFPSEEIKNFYDDLKTDFDLDDDAIIVKRWKSNIAYFNSNLKQANDNYSRLYDDLFKNKYIPEWYIDDICIDGRNLLIQYQNLINEHFFDNKFQKRISSNKHKLSYPDVDRIKAEIFENVSKNIFNTKNKTKYTTIYGVGLEECFIQIQNLVYLTIFYGSITHLKLVRELISNIMYMYADTFEDEEFYNLTLRMLFLSGEFEKYRKLFNKIKLNYSFVISKDFINSIIDSRNSLFKFEEDKSNIFLFEIYGRYIDDGLYIYLENRMLEIITIKDDYNINIISNTFKAIVANIKRLNNINKLLKIMYDYFEQSYSRFYVDIIDVLAEINVDKLDKVGFQEYQNIVDALIKQKQYISHKLSECLVKIKKRNPKISKYDVLFNQTGTTDNMVYKIKLGRNKLEVIKNIIEIYKERHEEREKTPGLISGYMIEYNLGVDIFTPKLYNGEIKKIILKEYLPLVQSILLSENELIYEKIKHIKLLSHLFIVEKSKTVKDNIIEIVHKSRNIKCCEYYGIGEMKLRDKVDLEVNIIMLDVIVRNIKYEDALCFYLEEAIKSPNNIGEILDCVLILNNFCQKKNDNVIDKLFFLFTIFYKVNDLDIRVDTIIMSQAFIGTKYQTKILNILEKKLNNMVFEECIGYIQLSKNTDKNKRGLYCTIITNLKNNDNYYIKCMAEKYL